MRIFYIDVIELKWKTNVFKVLQILRNKDEKAMLSDYLPIIENQK